MPITGFEPKQQANSGEGYNSPALEEGTYQCTIEKIEMREGTKYMSTEMETQLLCYLRPLDVPLEFMNKLLFYQTTTSFFNGVSEKAQSSLKASKLFTLIKTIYKTYKPDEDVASWKPDMVTDDVINFLEGKQLIAVVKLNQNGNNKVTDIMAAKVIISDTSVNVDDDFLKSVE